MKSTYIHQFMEQMMEIGVSHRMDIYRFIHQQYVMIIHLLPNKTYYIKVTGDIEDSSISSMTLYGSQNNAYLQIAQNIK